MPLGVSYQLGLLLEVHYLGEEVRDLLLLSGGVVTLPGQLFSQRGNLQVGITWKQQRESIKSEMPYCLTSVRELQRG